VCLQFGRRCFFLLHFLFCQHKRIKIFFCVVKCHSNFSVMSDFGFSILDIGRKIVTFAIHFFFSHANLKGRYFHQKAFLVSGLIICLGSLGLQHATANLELCKYCSLCQWAQFWKDTTGYDIDYDTSVYTPFGNLPKFTSFLLSIDILVNISSSLWSYHSRSVVTRCTYFCKIKIM